MLDLKKEINSKKKQGYYRKRLVTESPQDVYIKLNNKKVINFTSNDYLGLANNKLIKKAFIMGAKKYGVGSGSSPLISGYSIAHKKLEEEISEYLGFESTLVTNSGYLANVGLINAISEKNLIIFQDKLNHNSIIESSRLASNKLVRYKHLSYDDLKSKITTYKLNKKIIFSDSVFSMTGETSDLKKLSAIAKKNNALFFIDDAHGFCVMKKEKSPKLPSSFFYQGLSNNNIDAYMGTFGKAVGTFGSFISGSKDLIDLLVQKSKPYIYSTSIPPSIVEATRASLKIIIKNKSLNDRLAENIKFFKDTAKLYNLYINKSMMPIQTITLGSPELVMKIQKLALGKNLFVQAIRYPTVPKNKDLIRINITSKHTKKHIKELLVFLANQLF